MELVTGPRCEVMPAVKQLPAVREASGVASFRTHQETEAPRVHGLFSWKLVRIKSLACGPLCPTELHKHEWSRSETSPRGKKSRAGWEHLGTLERNQDTCSVKTQFNYNFNTRDEKMFDFMSITPKIWDPTSPLAYKYYTSTRAQQYDFIASFSCSCSGISGSSFLIWCFSLWRLYLPTNINHTYALWQIQQRARHSFTAMIEMVMTLEVPCL